VSSMNRRDLNTSRTSTPRCSTPGESSPCRVSTSPTHRSSLSQRDRVGPCRWLSPHDRTGPLLRPEQRCGRGSASRRIHRTRRPTNRGARHKRGPPASPTRCTVIARCEPPLWQVIAGTAPAATIRELRHLCRDTIFGRTTVCPLRTFDGGNPLRHRAAAEVECCLHRSVEVHRAAPGTCSLRRVPTLLT
jgi:hypothetical protein